MEKKQESIHMRFESFQIWQYVKTNWYVFVFLFLIVFGVYVNGLNNEFVSDDIESIQQKSTIVKQLSYVITSQIPLRLLVFYIAGNLGNVTPFLFRLFNVFFHLGSVWTVFILFGLFFNPTMAFFGASLFAVHPILVESITWITGGTYAQYSMFMLLSILCYLLSDRKKYYFLSLFFAICAQFTDMKAIVLPFLITLSELVFFSLKKNWKKLVPYFVFTGFYFVFIMGLGIISQRISNLQTFYYHEKGVDNPFIQIPIAITSYIRLFFWPDALTLYQSELNYSIPEFLVRIIVFILFCWSLFYFWYKDRRVFYWLSLFILSLLPTLTPLRISWVFAERYVYFGTVGLTFFTTYIIYQLSKKESFRVIVQIFFIFVFIAFSLRTYFRNLDWKNQDSLWVATAKYSPSDPKTHINLGDVYYRHGDMQKAGEEFALAIQLQPRNADAIHNLANVFYVTNKKKDAKQLYERAVEINPYSWKTLRNLSYVVYEEGDVKKAVEYIQKALAFQKDNPILLTDLAKIYIAQKRQSEARLLLEKAKIYDPQNQEIAKLLLSIK